MGGAASRAISAAVVIIVVVVVVIPVAVVIVIVVVVVVRRPTSAVGGTARSIGASSAIGAISLPVRSTSVPTSIGAISLNSVRPPTEGSGRRRSGRRGRSIRRICGVQSFLGQFRGSERPQRRRT